MLVTNLGEVSSLRTQSSHQLTEPSNPSFLSADRNRLANNVSPAGLRCWAADSRGEIGCLDVASKSMQQVLKGVGGSVRGLALYGEHSLMASAGLDRYLRIHDIQTRKVVARCSTQCSAVQQDVVETTRLPAEIAFWSRFPFRFLRSWQAAFAEHQRLASSPNPPFLLNAAAPECLLTQQSLLPHSEKLTNMQIW